MGVWGVLEACLKRFLNAPAQLVPDIGLNETDPLLLAPPGIGVLTAGPPTFLNAPRPQMQILTHPLLITFSANPPKQSLNVVVTEQSDARFLGVG